MPAKLISAFIVSSVLIVAPSVSAQTDEPIRLTPPTSVEGERPTLSPAQQQQIEARMSDVRKRLNLSEEQEEQLAPIMLASMEQTRSLMQKYGIQRGSRPNLSRRQMLSLRNDMTAARQSTDRQVSDILSRDQMREWRKIQDEMREEMRAQIRGR